MKPLACFDDVMIHVLSYKLKKTSPKPRQKIASCTNDDNTFSRKSDRKPTQNPKEKRKRQHWCQSASSHIFRFPVKSSSSS